MSPVKTNIIEADATAETQTIETAAAGADLLVVSGKHTGFRETLFGSGQSAAYRTVDCGVIVVYGATDRNCLQRHLEERLF